VLGVEHPDTLTSVGNLASVLRYRGKYEAAATKCRLVVPVLHGPRGPVREFEPAPSVLIPPARPQHAVKRLATGIRVWIHALTPLKRPQVDDGRDVPLNGAGTERLSDRGAIGAVRFF
jgi:hypothetical protein